MASLKRIVFQSGVYFRWCFSPDSLFDINQVAVTEHHSHGQNRFYTKLIEYSMHKENKTYFYRLTIYSTMDSFSILIR